MRRVFRITALSVAIGLIAALSVAGSVTAQTDLELTYSIPDARAYATKVSISKEVIEAAASRCHRHRPGEDHPPIMLEDGTEEDHSDTPGHTNYPYYCDVNLYEQVVNCPTWLAFGPAKEITVSPPLEVGDVNKMEGGADGIERSVNPPLATPVQLQDLQTSGRLTNFFGVQESGGFASRRYVDNSGRSVPTAHTESDGFSPNRNAYEERCYPVEDEKSTDDQKRSNFIGTEFPPNWNHVYSRSGQDPLTVHYSECTAATNEIQLSSTPPPSGECRFVAESVSNGAVPAAARHVLTIVKLHEKDGVLHGELLAIVEGLNFAGGAFTADSVVSYGTFSTDGTKEGLRWQVITYAKGSHICGSPTQLDDEDMTPANCGTADFSVGMAAPYVNPKSDGKELTMVSPGLVVAVNREFPFCQLNEKDPQNFQCVFIRPQTVYFAGFELRSSQDRSEPFTFTSTPFDIGPLDTFSALGTADYSLPVPPPPPPAEFGAERTVAVRQIGGSVLPAVSIIGFAGFAMLLLLFAWIRRFDWGASLFRIQPFKFFLWLHRAFVRT